MFKGGKKNRKYNRKFGNQKYQVNKQVLQVQKKMGSVQKNLI